MATRDRLTNEELKKLYKSNFDLANYAMQLARYAVISGHQTSVNEILDELIHHPNNYTFDELAEMIQTAKAGHPVEE